MGNLTENAGKRWTPDDINQLRQLAQQNTPTRLIALKLGRTTVAICSKAAEKRISLARLDQSSSQHRNS